MPYVLASQHTCVGVGVHIMYLGAQQGVGGEGLGWKAGVCLEEFGFGSYKLGYRVRIACSQRKAGVCWGGNACSGMQSRLRLGYIGRQRPFNEAELPAAS